MDELALAPAPALGHDESPKLQGTLLQEMQSDAQDRQMEVAISQPVAETARLESAEEISWFGRTVEQIDQQLGGPGAHGR